MKKQKHSYKSKHERQNEIILTAVGQYQRGQYDWTNAKMAKWLGLSASSKLKKMIDELVVEGILKRQMKIHRNSLMKNGNRLLIHRHVYTVDMGHPSIARLF